MFTYKCKCKCIYTQMRTSYTWRQMCLCIFRNAFVLYLASEQYCNQEIEYHDCQVHVSMSKSRWPAMKQLLQLIPTIYCIYTAPFSLLRVTFPCCFSYLPILLTLILHFHVCHVNSIYILMARKKNLRQKTSYQKD